ncbi:hypothetical protein CDO52_00950 [Nocardiopsis gilva YIM 90087]|uniref:Uncharacterized protein n=1 Tax=Nocardiopsis gilva YIM 90087 TaxID=1235441 RepID=A0A223S0C3_9ACTN|nr:hypothetical protein [Nocardiopsis gilva]ASU81547.1 hypothetical protein CDO52_00950 [Nocardiopsis gilva YIM 90087]
MSFIYCSRYTCSERAEVRVTCPATDQEYVLCSGHRAEVRAQLRERLGESVQVHESPLIEDLQEGVV